MSIPKWTDQSKNWCGLSDNWKLQSENWELQSENWERQSFKGQGEPLRSWSLAQRSFKGQEEPLRGWSLAQRSENIRIQTVESERLKKKELMDSENAYIELRQKESRERQKSEDELKAVRQASNVRIQLAEIRNCSS